MPDITMCGDNNCPSKDTCWCFSATPSPDRQSYFLETPRKEGESFCNNYWPIYMCKDRRCPSKNECRRYALAKSAPEQYFVDCGRAKGAAQCRMFWEVPNA